MKMTKVFAAAMAGTMVFATAAPVFASTNITSVHDGWWWEYDSDGDGTNDKTLTEDEQAKTIFDSGKIEGDGTWAVAMKCTETEMMRKSVKEKFDWDQVWVLTGDVYDDEDHWVSYGTHGDCWVFADGGTTGTCTGQNTSVDFTLEENDIVTFEITRDGQNFNINIAKNGKDLLRMKAADTNLNGDSLNTRVVAHFGDFEVFDMIEGTGKDAYEKAAATVKKEEPKTEAETESEKKDDAQQQTTNNESNSTSNENNATSNVAEDNGTDSGAVTQGTVAKTGDETPIIAILVALAGCGAIAFASKKRFVK